TIRQALSRIDSHDCRTPPLQRTPQSEGSSGGGLPYPAAPDADQDAVCTNQRSEIEHNFLLMEDVGFYERGTVWCSFPASTQRLSASLMMSRLTSAQSFSDYEVITSYEVTICYENQRHSHR